jgi:hypothetical protein
MPHRLFTDSHGVRWEVWEVEPSYAERRQATRDRRQVRRPGTDRRRVHDPMRVRISSELTHGWLAFQASHERRRLTPVPNGWELLGEDRLEELLHAATLVGRPRRLHE